MKFKGYKEYKFHDWLEFGGFILWELLMAYGAIYGSHINNDKIMLLGMLGMVIGIVFLNQVDISKLKKEIKQMKGEIK